MNKRSEKRNNMIGIRTSGYSKNESMIKTDKNDKNKGQRARTKAKTKG